MDKSIKTIDEYISEFPAFVIYRLNKIRSIIQKNAPEAKEEMIYGMPGYKIDQKPLVYFGGFAKHIGFYATPSTHDKFKQELSIYKQGKGSVQFPHDKELPVKLISEMVKYKVAENYQDPALKKQH